MISDYITLNSLPHMTIQGAGPLCTYISVHPHLHFPSSTRQSSSYSISRIRIRGHSCADQLQRSNAQCFVKEPALYECAEGAPHHISPNHMPFTNAVMRRCCLCTVCTPDITCRTLSSVDVRRRYIFFTRIHDIGSYGHQLLLASRLHVFQLVLSELDAAVQPFIKLFFGCAYPVSDQCVKFTLLYGSG